jgi:hypothetical protein
LGVRNAEKVRIQVLADLYSRDQMTAAYDKYIEAINSNGCTVDAVRLEFDASDGTTYAADIAPSELQRVTGPDGKKVAKKVPRNYVTGPTRIEADFGGPVRFTRKDPTR